MCVQELNARNSIILKLEELAKQDIPEAGIRKYLGYITAKGVLDLLNVAELEANPRRPQVNKATEAIAETLEKTPNLMCCKSKGLLISCSVVEELERNRLRLSFDPEYRNFEDVLDGGHNLFAISCFVIEQLLDEEEDLLVQAQKIKNWSDLKAFWGVNRDKVTAALHNNGVDFKFLVPVEILTVIEMNEETITRFTSSIFDISQARNNNVQLANLSAGNQKGVFELVKTNLPTYLKNIVAWTTGEPDKVVKGEYVLSLAALILMQLSKAGKAHSIMSGFHITPTSFYSGRGQCAKQVQEVLEKWDDIYSQNKLDADAVTIRESMKLLLDFPKIWDTIEYWFPALYNKFGGGVGKKGAYGRLSPFAKKTNKGRNATLRVDTPSRFHTPGLDQKKGSYPTQDGYVAPLMYSVTAFMVYDEEAGCIKWRKPVDDIVAFYSNTEDDALISSAIEQLGELIVSAVHGDPQALGKATYAYNAVHLAVSTAITNM